MDVNNKLKLNDEKTEFIVFGTPAGLRKVITSTILVGNKLIKASSSVRNIGAYLDQNLKMDVQVKLTCKSAWFHLYNISRIRCFLTSDQAKSVTHAYVTSKLDFNNVLLAGVPQYLTSKLQMVQNAAAKLITGSKKHDHVTPILHSLHWLPIYQRIIFKVLLLTFKALQGDGPLYLQELLLLHQSPRNLRSSSSPFLLKVPRSKLKTFGDKSFSFVAPEQWNKLPVHIRTSSSVDSFKSSLKTLLFSQHFNQ